MSFSSKIDLDFRPASYWSEHKRATANIRGTYRRKALKKALLRHDLTKISDLMQESNDEGFQLALGSISPALRSGEDLPLVRKNETEIARLRLTRTIHQEVTSIRARKKSGRIEYSVWAEVYAGLGDFKYRTTPRSSVKPLSMRELVKLIDTAKLVDPDGNVGEEGLVFRIWECDYHEGNSRDVARRSLEISSEFYPQLAQYYDEQFLVWARSQKNWSEDDLDPSNSSLTRQLSSQELERIANQLVAEGRMPSLEQYMQVRQKATAHWRGSELVFGVIRGGAGIDTLVFIPEERATELAAIRFAIAKATTWRQFVEMIPAHVWSQLLHDLEDNDSTPDLDSKFDPGMIGVEDGDWPDWPERKMMEWLPPEAVASYVTVHQSVINGPFLSIIPIRLAEVVKALESAGYTCHRDDPLVRQACGREDWADERDKERVRAPEGAESEAAGT